MQKDRAFAEVRLPGPFSRTAVGCCRASAGWCARVAWTQGCRPAWLERRRTRSDWGLEAGSLCQVQGPLW